jgi:DNA-binding PadR family transcriptional regulator
MTLAADRRAREDLDLFLLALISEGVDTPYRMQSLAGISQGTSLQSIKRLFEHGLIRSSAEGSRRRKTWSLTRTGRNRLQRDSRPRASQSPVNSNFEALLRTALLMAFVHGDFQSASSVLSVAATRPKKIYEDEARERGEVPEIASVYSRMRRLRMAQIARIEADVLKHLASDLRSRGKA